MEPVTLLLLQSEVILSWLHYSEVCLFDRGIFRVLRPWDGFILQPEDSPALGSGTCNLSSSIQDDSPLASLHRYLSIWNRGILCVLGPQEGFSLQPYDLWLLVVEPSTLVSMNQVDPAMMRGHGGGSIYSRATFHVYSIIARYQSPYLSACHLLMSQPNLMN